LAFPAATSINLFFSGAGAGGFGPIASGGGGASSPNDVSPIVITFSPSGRLDRIYAQGTFTQATESVYLFVARNDKQNADGSPNILGQENLEDMSNLWIAVGHRTGSIATVENANTLGMQLNAVKVAAARRFAREKTTMGAR
jgi:hypothetical protein